MNPAQAPSLNAPPPSNLLVYGNQPSDCSLQCPRLRARGLIPEDTLCGCASPYGVAEDRCGACPGPYAGSLSTTDLLPLCPERRFGPVVWNRF